MGHDIGVTAGEPGLFDRDLCIKERRLLGIGLQIPDVDAVIACDNTGVGPLPVYIQVPDGRIVFRQGFSGVFDIDREQFAIEQSHQ